MYEGSEPLTCCDCMPIEEEKGLYYGLWNLWKRNRKELL
jgi:hypothetical protein